MSFDWELGGLPGMGPFAIEARPATVGQEPTGSTTALSLMPRPLSIEREREFGELYAFVEFYMMHVSKVEAPPDLSMASVCADIVRRFGKSKALTGLRQAANDIVEDLSGRPAEGIAALDAALSERGILTVSEVRRRYSTVFERIVKRGAIRDETEYHLITGLVVDQTSDIEVDRRASLQRLLDAYDRSVEPES